MTKSKNINKYEFIRNFESCDKLLLNSFIVIRIDGRKFHTFTSNHKYNKPNDIRGLNLMNECASQVMLDITDIILAYGESDEYSFVFKKDTTFYQRRESKLISTVVSLFSSYFVFLWPKHFQDKTLLSPPSFDARAVLYPSLDNVKDYIRWRQVDLTRIGHINNLYNTAFWALVIKGNRSEVEAEKELMGTDSGAKNELLFTQFQINYNNEPEIFKKGTLLTRRSVDVEETTESAKKVIRKRNKIIPFHVDIVAKDDFWQSNPI